MLRCILRHYGVPSARLIPQDLRAFELGAFGSSWISGKFPDVLLVNGC